MDENPSIAGVTAVYVYDGRVIAHASDFNRARYGGFMLIESQTHRVEMALCFAVVRALASEAKGAEAEVGQRFDKSEMTNYQPRPGESFGFTGRIIHGLHQAEIRVPALRRITTRLKKMLP